MSSPASSYAPYRVSIYTNSNPPPPPPPKPINQEADISSASNISQPISSLTLQGLPCDKQVAAQSNVQPVGCAHSQELANLQAQDSDNSWLPKGLEDKSKQQLIDILESPKLLIALTHSTSTSHSSLKVCKAALQDALNENIALASHLKEVEARLIDLRSSTQAQLLSAHNLERQWRQKQIEMERALAAFAPPSLYQMLSQAIREQESFCSALEEEFLEENGGVAMEREIVEWVRKFREAKKTFYSRHAKKERWDEGRIGGWR